MLYRPRTVRMPAPPSMPPPTLAPWHLAQAMPPAPRPPLNPYQEVFPRICKPNNWSLQLHILPYLQCFVMGTYVLKLCRLLIPWPAFCCNRALAAALLLAPRMSRHMTKIIQLLDVYGYANARKSARCSWRMLQSPSSMMERWSCHCLFWFTEMRNAVSNISIFIYLYLWLEHAGRFCRWKAQVWWLGPCWWRTFCKFALQWTVV